ncbi:MAG: hypothetical protein QXI16_00785 [Sulfolobaceae archaeon]
MSTYPDVYAEIINRCKFMDIIFLGSDSFIGRLIREGQSSQTPDHKPSDWSHVCFYYNEHLILESTIGFERYKDGSIFSNGVQFYSLRERLASSGYNVAIARLGDDALRDVAFSRAVAKLRENIKYPIMGLIGSLLTYKFFKGRHANPLSGHKLYCSAFVAECIGDEEIIRRQAKYLKYPYNSYNFDNISPELLYQMYQDEVLDLVSKGYYL